MEKSVKSLKMMPIMPAMFLLYPGLNDLNFNWSYYTRNLHLNNYYSGIFPGLQLHFLFTDGHPLGWFPKNLKHIFFKILKFLTQTQTLTSIISVLNFKVVWLSLQFLIKFYLMISNCFPLNHALGTTYRFVLGIIR